MVLNIKNGKRTNKKKTKNKNADLFPMFLMSSDARSMFQYKTFPVLNLLLVRLKARITRFIHSRKDFH